MTRSSPPFVLTRTRRREPRVLPSYHTWNETVAESCGFYGIADSLTKCRYPRSCSDCLAKPGCMLLSDGFCVDTSYASTVRDALVVAAETGALNASSPVVQLPSNLTTLSFYENATYCAPVDAVCTACRREFDRMVRNETTREALDTAFCLGSDGQCVCAGVCEVPAYRATKVYDTQCEDESFGADLRRFMEFAKTIVDPSVDSWPSRSSPRRDPRAPMLPQMLQRKVNETCEFYGEMDAVGCQLPRSLRDCLRKPHCMISKDACVAAKSPVADLRNTSKLLLGTTGYYQAIGSDSSGVCGDTNDFCSFCDADIKLYEVNQTFNATARCIGMEGCVCDRYLVYLDKIRDDNPLSGLFGGGCSARAVIQLLDQKDNMALAIVLGFTAFIALVFGCSRYAIITVELELASQQVQDQAARIFRHMLDVIPRGLDLDLFGWRLFQRRIQYQERRLLRGEDNLSPVAYPMDLKDVWIPSAPEFDDDYDFSAPTKENPMALASAPIPGDDASGSVDTTGPSAPAFTAEERQSSLHFELNG